jgi:hypothetical protein
MRTTIELQDTQRARLLELAARRGEKGFSNLIAEAVERYLVAEDQALEKRELALAVRGSLTPDEAADLAAAARAVRESWR